MEERKRRASSPSARMPPLKKQISNDHMAALAQRGHPLARENGEAPSSSQAMQVDGLVRSSDANTLPSTVQQSAPPVSSAPEDPERKAETASEDTSESSESRGANEMPGMANLNRIQKEAIWLQMQQYKRENGRLEKRIQELEERQYDYSFHISTTDRYWRLIEEDIRQLLFSFGQEQEDRVDFLHDTDLRSKNFLQRLMTVPSSTNASTAAFSSRGLDSTLAYRSEFLHESLARLMAIADGALKARGDLSSILQDSEVEESVKSNTAVRTLTEENRKLHESTQGTKALLSDLQVKYIALSNEISELRDEGRIKSEKIKELSDQLDLARSSLMRAEKKLDRHLMGLVSSQLSAGLTSIRGPSAGGQGEDEFKLRNEVERLSELARSRLKELDEIRKERQQLLMENEKLKVQLIDLPEEKILQSDAYKYLFSQAGYYKTEMDTARSNMDKATAQLAEFQSRSKVQREQFEEEEKNRRRLVEQNLQKLQTDLLRVQADRDHLKKLLDSSNNKISQVDSLNNELKQFANALKIHNKNLQSELQRIKSKFMKSIGHASESDIIAELKQRVEKHEEREKEFLAKLEALRSSNEDAGNYAELTVRHRKLESDHETLQKRIAHLEKTNSVLSKDGDAIQVAFVTAQHRIEELEARVKEREETEDALIAEIEAAGKAFEDLQDQNTRLIQNLTEKEDVNTRLLAERLKWDEEHQAMAREREKFDTRYSSVKKQLTLLQEKIQKLEALQKASQATLTNIEKENASKQLVLDLHKRKAVESTHLATELQSRVEKLSAKSSEIKEILKQKTEQLETEMYNRNRIMEELTSCKKRMEYLERFENQSGDESLKEELNQYKELMKCNSCHLREKSTVLTKCMHVFCKQCIDTRLETRQRKCPNCGDSFSQNDVRQIYL